MDERLRALERRYRVSGSPQEGAEWLTARLRARDLEPLRLELAALCGDEAARLARPTPPDDQLLDAQGLEHAVREAGRLYPEQAIRRWVARGLPAARDGPARYDPVALLDWLDRDRESILGRLTVVFVHRLDALAAVRLVWAALREDRRRLTRGRRGWTGLLAAFEAWLDDPTAGERRQAVIALRDALPPDRVAPARALVRAMEELPDLAFTLAAQEAIEALGRRSRVAELACTTARRDLAAWAIGGAPPVWRQPYVVRTYTTEFRPSDWYDPGAVYVTWYYDVIDLRTSRLVRRFTASQPGEVEITPDGKHVVSRLGQEEERLELPP